MILCVCGLVTAMGVAACYSDKVSCSVGKFEGRQNVGDKAVYASEGSAMWIGG